MKKKRERKAKNFVERDFQRLCRYSSKVKFELFIFTIAKVHRLKKSTMTGAASALEELWSDVYQ